MVPARLPECLLLVAVLKFCRSATPRLALNAGRNSCRLFRSFTETVDFNLSELYLFQNSFPCIIFKKIINQLFGNGALNFYLHTRNKKRSEATAAKFSETVELVPS